MSDEAIRIAVGLRVGAPLGQPHQCSYCGNDIGQFFRYGLSCRSSQGRLSRHNTVNSTIQHAFTAAKISSWLEPSGLHQADGKRPDGMTMVPWEQGKYLVRDATCVDTFQSHCRRAATEPGGAAAHAEEDKTRSMHTWTACSCCGDMWHHRQTFKNSDRGTAIVCFAEEDKTRSMHTWTACSCCGDMWHHRQTFKNSDRGTAIVCLPNAENFRCHSNRECNISNCLPPCQCNN